MILNRSAAILPLRWPNSSSRALSSFAFQSPSLLPNSPPTSLHHPPSLYLRHQRLLLKPATALKQKWIEVTVATQVDVLLEAVCHGSGPQIYDSTDGVQRTMVFVNTVVAVESVAKKLQGAGITRHCYHQDTSLESAEVLTDFKQNGGVLVCTEAAARGPWC